MKHLIVKLFHDNLYRLQLIFLQNIKCKRIFTKKFQKIFSFPIAITIFRRRAEDFVSWIYDFYSVIWKVELKCQFLTHRSASLDLMDCFHSSLLTFHLIAQNVYYMMPIIRRGWFLHDYEDISIGMNKFNLICVGNYFFNDSAVKWIELNKNGCF